jgi:RNA polymerase sigma factor (sigma-70 family)
VIQQVFLALHRAIGRGLDLTESLNGWLRVATYRYARNCRVLARCGRELLTREGDIEAEDEGPSPEADVMMNQARRIVMELLDELPDDLRLVLAMSDLDDMPMSEIAEVLEIPEGTGSSRLRAARLAFEKAWARRREKQAPRAVALGMAPFLLFDARSLLAIERSIPVGPPGLNDRGWSRLVDALGPGLQGPAALAAAAGAAGAGAAAAKGATAAKVLAALAVKQIAIVVVSASIGAAIHAALGPTNDEPVVVAISREDGRNAAAVLSSGAGSEPRAPVASATAAIAIPKADAGAAIDAEQDERNVIHRARAALGRAALASDEKTRARELAAAFAALDEHERRFKTPHNAEEREATRRQALAFRQAHSNQDGGQR